ncbi:MAG: alpha/beta fold hydrolase [Henriciella sp.]|nr:alpha/beta fold hydrolase [Henriciella sp.]
MMTPNRRRRRHQSATVPAIALALSVTGCVAGTVSSDNPDTQAASVDETAVDVAQTPDTVSDASEPQTEVTTTATEQAASGQADVEFPPYVLEPGKMLDVGGYSLNTYCFGEGAPTVIMESGGGWGAIAWAGIQSQIAETTRVCSYDRAGMMFSDIRPGEATPGQDMADLTAWLKASGEAGPYVMVGWSAGGMIIRDYAWTYPERVAGLVTVDGSTFDFGDGSVTEEDWYVQSIAGLTNCQAAAEAGTLAEDPDLLTTCAGAINPLMMFPDIQAIFGPQALEAERYANMVEGLKLTEAGGAYLQAKQESFGDLPLHVLVAGSHGEDSPFAADSRTIASWSSKSTFEIVPNAGHMIHYDQPEPVLAAILGMVQQVRAETAE